MLRASADQTDRTADTAGVADDDVDPGVPGGRELVAFTNALLGADRHDDAALLDARRALVATVGPAGAARAATVAGNFEMMNRLLDAAGVPVPESMVDFGRTLDVVG